MQKNSTIFFFVLNLKEMLIFKGFKNVFLIGLAGYSEYSIC